uniref:P5A-ATPase transmembrane helical hairpin domain-containing protein n=1 Tax=Phaeomonas parva TaxID=124430 RepID=A0A7S1XS79_9STRA
MAAGGMQLADPALAEARLLVQRPAWSRLDVAPFALLYISLHSVLLQCEPGSWRETQALVVYGVALLLHLLTVLFARWSVRVRAMVGYVPCAVLEAASHALVCPKPNFGRGAIVRLEHAAEVAAGESVEVLGRAFPLDEARLTFQSARYEVTGAEPTLRRLAYPEGAEVAAVRAWEGFADPAAWQRALRRWGRNVCDIPAPEFLELFLEQATAPFFLFQVLCVVLWSLDDYWVYSVFTLFMLVVFEATVTMNRLSALSTLRDMRRPASVVYAYRLRRWLPVSSEDLLPGDIISVGGEKPHPQALSLSLSLTLSPKP